MFNTRYSHKGKHIVPKAFFDFNRKMYGPYREDMPVVKRTLAKPTLGALRALLLKNNDYPAQPTLAKHPLKNKTMSQPERKSASKKGYLREEITVLLAIAILVFTAHALFKYYFKKDGKTLIRQDQYSILEEGQNLARNKHPLPSIHIPPQITAYKQFRPAAFTN